MNRAPKNRRERPPRRLSNRRFHPATCSIRPRSVLPGWRAGIPLCVAAPRRNACRPSACREGRWDCIRKESPAVRRSPGSIAAPIECREAGLPKWRELAARRGASGPRRSGVAVAAGRDRAPSIRYRNCARRRRPDGGALCRSRGPPASEIPSRCSASGAWGRTDPGRQSESQRPWQGYPYWVARRRSCFAIR